MERNTIEFLFPPCLISELKDTRGKEWYALIEEISNKEPLSIERIGFELFIVRLNNCASCHADSYRSLHGCLKCARQSMTRYKGDDKELMGAYKKACMEVETFLKKEENYYWNIG